MPAVCKTDKVNKYDTSSDGTYWGDKHKIITDICVLKNSVKCYKG